ncbi:hydrolase [Edwardsiella hoshinae]|uniref:Hydrolase n=2 Tax=Edwardsiella hoshinae TaxID=93378 RepID=A0ABM6ENG1_9GAMM|nr:C40 family peptidase [Edwardsiella hoshinae]AOV98559.1 hydrolase [Edwardsiella hoshinae]QPR29798.1 C40 family peptidase [Edwardsiella hoshinae]
MRLFVALFVLLFTQWFTTSAAAAPAHKITADQRKSAAAHSQHADRKKRKSEHSASKQRVTTRHVHVQRSAHPPARVVSSSHAVQPPRHNAASHSARSRHAATSHVRQRTAKKHYGRPSARQIAHHATRRHEQEDRHPLRLSQQHKKRYQHAKQTAMNKLMRQIGKPYRWGGSSPHTGFDCSGLIYYAYQDLLNIKMPRTANEMYHLRDAAPVKRNELQRGDLVFFQINGRGAADHVGVYLGNGKFIQSPRTGEEIRISYLGDDYWQNHYLGARRVMTPKTIR